jgi:hypothetical protein
VTVREDRIDWKGLLAGVAIGRTFGRLFLFVGVFYLAVAAFILVMGWETGPERAIAAQRAKAFTHRETGRIVESWVALDLDTARLEGVRNWPGFTRVSPCAIVEWGGPWGTAQRAFCGTSEHLHSEFRVHDLRELTPGVPFDFARDANGFRMPEIRMSKAALDYLASHPPMSAHGRSTALDEFRRRMDRPDDAAIESWTTKAPGIALAFDPANPSEPLPAGFIDARLASEPNWLAAAAMGFFGLAFWFAGMNVVLMGMAPAARVVVGFLPLLGLPWFAQELPNALRHANLGVAEWLADTVADIEITSRVAATEPDAAGQRSGERLVFVVNRGLYADTLGLVSFQPPPAPLEANAALARLAEMTARHVRAMSDTDRATLFARLRRDKKDELLHAGILFVRAAKQVMLDAAGDAAARKAARDFLSEWVVQPVLEPDKREPAFREKATIYRGMLDIPDPLIANPASWIVERASSR